MCFQRLDPLNVPTLTAEQLAEKQKVADEKREAVSFSNSHVSYLQMQIVWKKCTAIVGFKPGPQNMKSITLTTGHKSQMSEVVHITLSKCALTPTVTDYALSTL